MRAGEGVADGEQCKVKVQGGKREKNEKIASKTAIKRSLTLRSIYLKKLNYYNLSTFIDKLPHTKCPKVLTVETVNLFMTDGK